MKLGRNDRICRPDVPHLSALLKGEAAPRAPDAIDWSTHLPEQLGMMLNGPSPENPPDLEGGLGDCTCAALYHAIQVWSSVARERVYTEGNLEVVTLYERACGYIRGIQATDQGGVEQNVLAYAVNQGMPVWPSASALHHLHAFVEVDPRNATDVNYAIYACGLVYLGFDVPAYLMDGRTIWDVDPNADSTIVGGHAVISPGYFANGNRKIISWGSAQYEMTPAFWSAHVDECYAIVDPLFIQATGVSPLGWTLEAWAQQMSALKVMR